MDAASDVHRHTPYSREGTQTETGSLSLSLKSLLLFSHALVLCLLLLHLLLLPLVRHVLLHRRRALTCKMWHATKVGIHHGMLLHLRHHLLVHYELLLLHLLLLLLLIDIPSLNILLLRLLLVGVHGGLHHTRELHLGELLLRLHHAIELWVLAHHVGSGGWVASGGLVGRCLVVHAGLLAHSGGHELLLS